MAVEDIAVKALTGSGLTNGHPAALTGSQVTMHNPPSGETHRVIVEVNNPTASPIDLTLRFTESATNRDLVISIAAKASQKVGDFEFNNSVTMSAAGNGLFLWANIRRIN